MTMVKKIMGTIRCLLGGHEYTCRAGEDIAPTDKQLQDGLQGFKDYAMMYCSRCKKEFPYEW
jgi:hypothetical protein